MYVDPRYFAVSTSPTVWYEDFVDILGGNHKIGLYLGVISSILGYFLKVKVQIKFQIFWGT